MDIPELVRQLLVLKSKLKVGCSMTIAIGTKQLSVTIRRGLAINQTLSIPLTTWRDNGSELLNECYDLAVKHKLITEQQTLNLW